METPYDHRSGCRYAAYGLDGKNGSILAARDRTREFLGALTPPISADTTTDALTLVSELVTNAVRHAPGPCALYLVHTVVRSSGAPELTVAVSDTSTIEPSPRTPDLLAGTGGLGWHMVERLTTTIQIHAIAERGKTIETTLATITL